MPKINIPLHSSGEFESLQQALTVLKQKGNWYSSVLADIVLYNVCYRDYLREHGLQPLEHSRRYLNYGEAQQKQSSGVYVQAYHEAIHFGQEVPVRVWLFVKGNEEK